MKTFIMFLTSFLMFMLEVLIVVSVGAGYLCLKLHFNMPITQADEIILEWSAFLYFHNLLPAILIQKSLRKVTAFVSVKSVSHS